MKKLIFAIIAAAATFGASAQIIRSTTSERTFTANEPAPAKTFSNYAILALSYDNMHFGANKYAGGSDASFGTNGVGFQFIKGYSVSRQVPLYIEWGLNLSYGMYSDSESAYGATITSKFRDLSFGLPINVAYRYQITNGFFVKPYLGLNFRVHAMADACTEAEYNGEKYTEDGYGDWNSVYDEDGYKRFQMGWHIGASLEYKRLYFGLQYGTDFMGFFSYDDAKVNTGMFRLSLGVSF